MVGAAPSLLPSLAKQQLPYFFPSPEKYVREEKKGSAVFSYFPLRLSTVFSPIELGKKLLILHDILCILAIFFFLAS